MTEFRDLTIGDVFNTKEARWVKTHETEAMVIMDGMLLLGSIHSFDLGREVIVLYRTLGISYGSE